jgi:hypothetical protein
MKTWSDPRSPWGKRLKFESDEFEAMMDAMRASAGGGGFQSGKGVDVELVLLRALGVEADYVELPVGILGRTVFLNDGKIVIEISRSLSDAAETSNLARRRLRTTLAHEFGHAVCHGVLFFRDSHALSLFAVQEEESRGGELPPIMCREEGIDGKGYSGEWWEFQANQCMAALLLPRRMLGESVRRQLSKRDFASVEACISQGAGEQFVKDLAEEYDVSATATLFRLQALGFIPDGSQLSVLR